MPPDAAPALTRRAEASPYAWYMLGVLVLVYVFNYVDRQLLTILAPELKRDLGISDSDFGFLYGTAFGVFYGLFGIPLGRLADRWSRVRLLAIGLTLWSAMTALSGLSRNYAQLAMARAGVGIGEATAQPCAFSLIADRFPPHRRATAIGIYCTGLFLGGGVSLFLGSTIVQEWNAAFPADTAPLGLRGWQAAFLVIGLPGLLLAAWVATLREPIRGAFEPGETPNVQRIEGSPLRALLRDLGDVLPPFTLIAAARRGMRAMVIHAAGMSAVALVVLGLIAVTGDIAQWLAVGLGLYAVWSWATAMRHTERETFAALFRSHGFIAITLGYAAYALLAQANLAFIALYAIEDLQADPKAAGFALGGIGALGGVIGMVAGGMLSDRLAAGGMHARRVALTIAGAVIGLACHAAMFLAESLAFYYPAVFVMQLANSIVLGGSSSAIVSIMQSRLRGVATGGFLLGGNILGLGLGPYAGGKMSELSGDLGTGLLTILAVGPLSLIAFVMGWRSLRRAERDEPTPRSDPDTQPAVTAAS